MFLPDVVTVRFIDGDEYLSRALIIGALIVRPTFEFETASNRADRDREEWRSAAGRWAIDHMHVPAASLIEFDRFDFALTAADECSRFALTCLSEAHTPSEVDAALGKDLRLYLNFAKWLEAKHPDEQLYGFRDFLADMRDSGKAELLRTRVR